MRMEMDDGFGAAEGGRPEPVQLLDDARVRASVLPDLTMARVRAQMYAADRPKQLSSAMRKHPVRTFAIAFGLGWGIAKLTRLLLRTRSRPHR